MHWLRGFSLIADSQREEARREIRMALDLGYKLKSSQEEETARQLLESGGESTQLPNSLR